MTLVTWRVFSPGSYSSFALFAAKCPDRSSVPQFSHSSSAATTTTMRWM